MNESMKKILAEYAGTETLVNIYTDPEDSDRFTIGYILGADDKYVLMNEIDTGGLNGGFSLICLNDIFKIETDEPYCWRLLKLYNYKGQERSRIDIAGSMYNTILKYAFENRRMIEINSDRNCRGFVTEFNSGYLKIDVIDFWGKLTGMTAVDSDNINIIICADEALKNQEILYLK